MTSRMDQTQTEQMEISKDLKEKTAGTVANGNESMPSDEQAQSWFGKTRQWIRKLLRLETVVGN